MTRRLTPPMLGLLAVAFTAAASAGAGRRDEDTAIVPPQGARLPGAAWRSRERHGRGARRHRGRARKPRHKHAQRPTFDAERTSEDIRFLTAQAAAAVKINGKGAGIVGYADAPDLAAQHIRSMVDDQHSEAFRSIYLEGNEVAYPVFPDDPAATTALEPAMPTEEQAKLRTAQVRTLGAGSAWRDLGPHRGPSGTVGGGAHVPLVAPPRSFASS